MAGLIFASALFGILTRPVGFLAAFWPANALLLGVMVRYPRLNTVPNWWAALVGYFAADLLTGGGFLITLWLTAANLAGAMVGVYLFCQLTEEDRKLQRPLSALYLLCICVVCGLVAAIVGGGAAPVLFGKALSTGIIFWFTTELVNDLLLLPVLLAAPPVKQIAHDCIDFVRSTSRNPRTIAPLAALLASMAVSQLVEGPGAVIFSVPALLWCALTYSLFTTAFLTMLNCSWMLVATSAGMLHIIPVSTDFIAETISLRLGISLLALGPLTAASINSARESLLNSLDHAVNHDFLTNTLARRALMQFGSDRLKQGIVHTPSPAVLMLDIDHFKRVNDTYGHAAGDQVLVSFSRTVSSLLRSGDLFGRMGGEEFAVVLPEIESLEAWDIAERLRIAVASTPIELTTGESLSITTSVGIACAKESIPMTLDQMLLFADRALYQSKLKGRNRTTSVYCQPVSVEQAAQGRQENQEASLKRSAISA